MEKAETAGSGGVAIAVNDLVAQSRSRVEVPRILDQLKRISALRIDDFILSSGGKLESTVTEMFSIIKELERHLRDVLTLNATLQEELRDGRKTNAALQQEKDAATAQVAGFERDMPRVQDLEKRLEMTISEVERFRALYRQEQQQVQKVEASHQVVVTMAQKVREERDDAYREVVVMGDKLKSLGKAGR